MTVDALRPIDAGLDDTAAAKVARKMSQVRQIWPYSDGLMWCFCPGHWLGTLLSCRVKII